MVGNSPQGASLSPLSSSFGAPSLSSVSSVWSIFSPASSEGSHASSVSSFYSPQTLPTTPPNQNQISIQEFQIGGSESNGSATTSAKDCEFRDSSITQFDPHGHDYGHLAAWDIGPKSEWEYQPRPRAALFMDFQQYPSNEMMPAAVEFTSAMNANLVHHSAGLASEAAEYSAGCHSATLVQNDHLEDNYSETIPSSSLDSGSGTYMAGIPWYDPPSNSTIVPTQTIKEYPDIYTQAEQYLRPPKQALANSHERVSFDIIKREMDVSDLELDTPVIISNSPSQPQYRRTITKNKTNGRGIRKKRHPSGSLNDTKAQFLLRNGTVLTMDKPTAGKRHACPYLLPGPNGKYCDKKFQRSEHLKRHLLIHIGTDFHACPDPACSLRILSRADNMRRTLQDTSAAAAEQADPTENV